MESFRGNCESITINGDPYGLIAQPVNWLEKHNEVVADLSVNKNTPFTVASSAAVIRMTTDRRWLNARSWRLNLKYLIRIGLTLADFLTRRVYAARGPLVEKKLGLVSH